jgi:phosphoglycerate dehydrogenase-like enzyme
MPNVILTPHIGGSSLEAQDENRRTGTAEIRRVRDGVWPQNVVNPEVKNAKNGLLV